MSNSYTNTDGRSETLNQEAMHETGIYDPNVHDNQIVAMYETDARAQAARDTLISNGIPERAIQVTTGEQGRRPEGTDDDPGRSGLWASIANLFMPHEEAYGYAEGVRRGHAIVVVRPDATLNRHRIVQILESTDPVDFDAKLEEWRQAGYSDSGAAETGTIAAGATGAAMGTLARGAVTDTSAMRGTDTTAAGTFRNAPPSSTRQQDRAGGERSADLPRSTYETGSNLESREPARAAATPPAASTTPPDDVQRARPFPGPSAPGPSAPGPSAPGPSTIGQDETIKIIEERLQVGKREVVKGAVRVRSYVVERPVEQQVQLHEERVAIERHPVDRPVSAADGSLFRERTVEARATGEEAVVSKEARVVEEVGLHKEATDRTETVRDTVRNTEVEIDGDPSAASRTQNPA